MKRPVCLVCLIFCFVYLILLNLLPVPDLLYEDGQRLILEGIISELSQTEYGQVILLKDVYVISTNQIQKENQKAIQQNNFSNTKKKLNMDVKVYLSAKETVFVGQYVWIEGVVDYFKAASNPGAFDDQKYERTQNIAFALKKSTVIKVSTEQHLVKTRLAKLRNRIANVYEKNAVHDELLKTMVLGLKRELSEEIKALYQRTGISHLLAISALHLSLIGMSIYKVSKKVGMPLFVATILSVVVLILFGQMTGSSISTVRAVLMFSLTVFATLLGRTYDLLTALALSFMIMVLLRPYALQNSGFLLSFSAVLGIGIALPYFSRTFGRGKIRTVFFVTLSVNLFTLPVVLSSYYSFSPYSILINMLVVPGMGIVLLFGILGGIAGCVMERVSLIFYPADCILAYYEKLCLFAEKLPGGMIVFGKPKLWQLICYYLILVGFLFFAQMKDYLQKQLQKRGICQSRAGMLADTERKQPQAVNLKNRRRQKIRTLAKESAKLFFICLLLLAILYFPMQIERKGRCELTMLDIGQGDCMVLEVYGTTMLIDGGSSSQKQIETYQILPFLKSRGIAKVDYLFLSHPDEDHMNGIEALLNKTNEGCSYGTLFLTEYGKEQLILQKQENRYNDEASLEKGEKELSLVDAAEQAGCEIRLMRAGDYLQLKHGCKLSCLLPAAGESFQDANDSSMTLVFEGNGEKILFLGDLPKEREVNFLQNKSANDLLKNITVLKVSHHGSKTGTSEELLQKIKPLIALISCGEDNRYGHPHKEVIERLDRNGISVFRTDLDGAITVKLRKRKAGICVKTFKSR